jgi:hypothetical protein
MQLYSIGIDLSDITNRLDTIEAKGPSVVQAIVICLQFVLGYDRQLLANAVDGREYKDENGNTVVWDATVAQEYQDKITAMETLITSLQT